VSQTDPAVIEEVKRAIPNLIDVTVAEGTRILRDKTLSEFMATGKEMEAQIKQAELRFAQAQRDKSEAAQQTARAQLQKLQNERTEKLNDIASRLQEQISAFEKMKKP
jgi:predicted transglutaminase-like cysteine proteinase